MKINQPGIFLTASKVLAIHFTLFSALFLFIYYFSFGNLAIDFNLLNYWDTGWYLSIRDIGYHYREAAQNNTAFFPLFPYFWKVTGLGIAGMCFANLFIFVLGFYIFVYFFQPKEKTQYLYLAIPCLLFFAVPYSESLFFLFTTLMLVGIKTKKHWLTLLFLILATLTRSAGTIFIPAFIASAVFISDKTNFKKTILEYASYIFVCIATTFAVIYLHFAQTGVWFAAAKTQKHWEHSFRIPDFPLTSWHNSEILRLDGTALFIGIIALGILLKIFISKFKKSSLEAEPYYLFSLLYLGGISLSILLFQGGDLHSLNRYIFATPFFFIFLLQLEKKTFTYREILIVLLFLLFYWLLFGSYKHISSFINYLRLSILLAIFLLAYTSKEKIARGAFIIVYILATLCQAYLFYWYMKGSWIG